jgi:carnitine 3-dehydrogenase
LRWSFMGTMLTYRIAGGEGGMRHFMSQFGPALQWPWTRLMDVPELTEDFLDRLQTQSDEQANGTGLRDLEALRDACLVSVMHGLANQNYASGEVLNKYEEYLKSNSHI